MTLLKSNCHFSHLMLNNIIENFTLIRLFKKPVNDALFVWCIRKKPPHIFPTKHLNLTLPTPFDHLKPYVTFISNFIHEETSEYANSPQKYTLNWVLAHSAKSASFFFHPLFRHHQHFRRVFFQRVGKSSGYGLFAQQTYTSIKCIFLSLTPSPTAKASVM